MNLPDLPRFYTRHLALGSAIELSDEEARHAKVLRLQPGSEIQLVNGVGQLASATVVEHKKRFSARINTLTEPTAQESNLCLAVAPTKNTARMEMVVEKATEIGVQRIIPIQCAQSERSRVNTARLQKIAISAMKQSEGLWLPQIDELTDFQSILGFEGECWMAHCEEDEKKEPLSALMKPVDTSKLVAIGPEGDFSTAEINDAHASGFKMLDLGEKRLRTETAALVVCLAKIIQ